jgi:hypothetical protein
MNEAMIYLDDQITVRLGTFLHLRSTMICIKIDVFLTGHEYFVWESHRER